MTYLIKHENPNIRYVGRWDKSNKEIARSYWGGAYFKFKFTGTTVQINLAHRADILVSLDHKEDVLHANAEGIVDLTLTPLTDGVHSIRVAARYQDDELHLKEIQLDSEAATLEPDGEKELIEFIGDSITIGDQTTNGALSSYAWLTGEALNAEHTSIAYSGITLVNGYHHPGEDAPQTGMEIQYFQTKQPNHTPNPDWDFSAYDARLVVINLGSNDHFLKVSPELVHETYITFLKKVREKRTDADIVVLRTFGSHFVKATEDAVEKRRQAGDHKLHYIDTAGWLNINDYFDAVHPTDAGNIKAAGKLIPLLRKYLT